MTDPSNPNRGCCGCLIGGAVLLFAASFLGYFFLMHSPMPLRWAAKQAGADDVQMEGITGNLAKGFAVEALSFPAGNGEHSEIEGFVLRYNSLFDAMTNNRIVIDEISVVRAHLYFDRSTGSVARDDEDDDEDEDEDEDDGDGDESGAWDEDEDDPGTATLDLFEIKKIDLNDLVLESTDGELRFTLDRLYLEGLRLEDDEFDLAALEVKSDALDIELVDFESTLAEADDALPYRKRIQGRVSSEIDEALLADFDFTIDFAAVDSEIALRVVAIDGAFEAVVTPDQDGSVRLKDFTPGEFIVIEGGAAPERINLLARTEGDRTMIENGSFMIGRGQFRIPPQEIDDSDDGAPEPLVTATCRLGALRIDAQASVTGGVQLSSQPERPIREILSRLYFEKAPGELSPPEQATLDERVERYETETEAESETETEEKEQLVPGEQVEVEVEVEVEVGTE